MKYNEKKIKIHKNGILKFHHYEITDFTSFTERPGEMIRRMLKYAVGKDKLIHMTAKGTAKREGLDPLILKDVTSNLHSLYYG